MALFIDHAGSHRWAKVPKPSATDPWIGRHGGTETPDDMILNIDSDIGSHDTDPFRNLNAADLWHD